jgi:hypothetical protein
MKVTWTGVAEYSRASLVAFAMIACDGSTVDEDGGSPFDAGTSEERDATTPVDAYVADANTTRDANTQPDATIEIADAGSDASTGTPGDLCEAPLPYVLGETVVVRGEYHTEGHPLLCARDLNRDAFFQFVLSETSDLRFVVDRPTLDEVAIHLFADCDSEALTCTGYDSKTDEPLDREITRVPAGSYLLALTSSGADPSFRVDATAPAPRNDACADAYPVLDPDALIHYPGHGFTNDFAGCGSHGAEADMFFYVDVETTSYIDAIILTAGMNSDVTLLDGCGGAVQGCSTDTNFHSFATEEMPPGRYYFGVDYNSEALRTLVSFQAIVTPVEP